MLEHTNNQNRRTPTKVEKLAAGAFVVALASGPVYAQLQETPAAQQEAAKYVLGIYGEIALGAGTIAFAKRAAEVNQERAMQSAAELPTYIVQPPHNQL